MNMMRDYRAITNSQYRLVCNFAIPVGIAAVSILLAAVIEGRLGVVTAFCVGTVFLAALEVFGDYFGFGSICAKGCLGMDYLKTSPRGKQMLCHALLADILVRPVRIAGSLLLIGIAYEIMSGNPVRPVLIAMLLVADISVWCLNITRYMQNVQGVSFVSMLASAATGAGTVCFGYAQEVERFVWLIVAGLVMLLVLGVSVTYKHLCRKVEQSYIDGLEG